MNRLTAAQVRGATNPGRLADGGNLYLVTDNGGAKRWSFLFRWQGRLREMGMGGVGGVSLAQARQRAGEARAALAEGRNPIDDRRAAKAAERTIPTFSEVADAYIAAHSPAWRSRKHRDQWSTTLRDYAQPIRDMLIDAIRTEDVLACLKPVWQAKPETASRVRGRIEAVLDAAKAAGHRAGENPARWRGHLDHLLPNRQRLTRGHHAAMPYAEVPAFMARLAAAEGGAALALRFLVLTAARSGEALGATWAEMDLDEAVWTVPASRMKAGAEHRVALSRAAKDVVKTAQKLVGGGGYVFTGQRAGRPLSGTSLVTAMRRFAHGGATVHGFRASFKTWAGETTAFPRELAEAALAHTIGDATERAYARGDLLARRRELMEAWAAHCTGQGADVIPLRQRTRQTVAV